MKQANIDYLEANIQHLENARNQFFRNLQGDIRVNFERIMAEEFRPGYKADIFCDKCALEMIKILDIYYRQWKDRQPTVVAEEAPITIHATFPSHKAKKTRNAKFQTLRRDR